MHRLNISLSCPGHSGWAGSIFFRLFVVLTLTWGTLQTIKIKHNDIINNGQFSPIYKLSFALPIGDFSISTASPPQVVRDCISLCLSLEPLMKHEVQVFKRPTHHWISERRANSICGPRTHYAHVLQRIMSKRWKGFFSLQIRSVNIPPHPAPSVHEHISPTRMRPFV